MLGLFSLLLFSGLFDLLLAEHKNMLPASPLFLALIVLLAALTYPRLSNRTAVAIFSVNGYLYISLALAIPADDFHVLDFFLIFKPIIFLLFALWIAKSRRLRLNVEQFWSVILWVFLLKYLFTRILGLDDRPQVFEEQNFELLFIVLIAYYIHARVRSLKKQEFFKLVMLFVLAGSRSGIVTLVIMLVLTTWRTQGISGLARMWWVLLPSAAIATYIFMSRLNGGSLMSIDRVQFAFLFLDETREWSIGQFLIGARPITPLSVGTCDNMYRSYSSTFSFVDPRICYSTVFHSFLLRAVFDHGVIGLFLIVAGFYIALRHAGNSRFDTRSVLLLIFLNGLSVSGFGNTYAFLGLVPFLLLPPKAGRKLSFT